jgi:glycosyltransferase involved in cell wall biosynthesis
MKIAWLSPYSSDKLWDPAVRLRRWNVHNKLLEMGVQSKFIWSCEDDLGSLFENIKDFDIVVQTEHSESLVKLMHQLKSVGVKQVRDHCELLFGFPFQAESFSLMDCIVCSSEVVASATAAQGFDRDCKIKIVEDMWEDRKIQNLSDHPGPLKAVFMGTGTALDIAEGAVQGLLNKHGFDLTIISDRDEHIKWSKDTCQEHYSGHDIAVCPQDPNNFSGKSSVKLVQALSFGYPTIASPLRSYADVLNRSGSGVVAGSAEEWEKAIKFLSVRENRISMHNKALIESQRYSPENIALEWYKVFYELNNDL